MTHGYKRVIPGCVRDALAHGPAGTRSDSVSQGRGEAQGATIGDSAVPGMAGASEYRAKQSVLADASIERQIEFSQRLKFTCFSCRHSEGRADNRLWCVKFGRLADLRAVDCFSFEREPGTQERGE